MLRAIRMTEKGANMYISYHYIYMTKGPCMSPVIWFPESPSAATYQWKRRAREISNFNNIFWSHSRWRNKLFF